MTLTTTTLAARVGNESTGFLESLKINSAYKHRASRVCDAPTTSEYDQGRSAARFGFSNLPDYPMKWRLIWDELENP